MKRKRQKRRIDRVPIFSKKGKKKWCTTKLPKRKTRLKWPWPGGPQKPPPRKWGPRVRQDTLSFTAEARGDVLSFGKSPQGKTIEERRGVHTEERSGSLPEREKSGVF